MLDIRPAREALKGMEIAIPPGQDLPPQSPREPYEQRPLPPIPPRSLARVTKSAASSPPRRSSVPAPSAHERASSLVLVPSVATPKEEWRRSRGEVAHNDKPRPAPIDSKSRAPTGQYVLYPTPPTTPRPTPRLRSRSFLGAMADTKIVSQAVTAKSPPLSPTLHNSPGKIKQMTGHDVNINFDTSHPRAQSGSRSTSAAAAYAAPPSCASSCYSDGSLETTMSEPAPCASTAHLNCYSRYNELMDQSLLEDGYDCNRPSCEGFPRSHISAHVDPLIARRRAEVIRGQIRLDPAIYSPPWTPESTGPHRQPHEPRRTSGGSVVSNKAKMEEEYIIKDLYHESTAQIAASAKRRESHRESRRAEPHSSRKTLEIPTSVRMTGPSGRQVRMGRPTSLPFSFAASDFIAGDRRAPRPPRPAEAHAASVFEFDDERPSYMSRVFRRRSGRGGTSTASSPERRVSRAKSVRIGIQDLVAQARKGAGLLTKEEKRRASLRHKIRVVLE